MIQTAAQAATSFECGHCTASHAAALITFKLMYVQPHLKRHLDLKKKINLHSFMNNGVNVMLASCSIFNVLKISSYVFVT